MSNSVITLSSFNLLFFTQVLTVLTSTIKYNEYVRDKGENISIPCIADGNNIMWVKENGNNSTIIQTGKYLVLTNISTSDKGIYVCFAAVTPKSIETQQNEEKEEEKRYQQEITEENHDDDDDAKEEEEIVKVKTKIIIKNEKDLEQEEEEESLQQQPSNENVFITATKTNTTTTTITTQNASTTSMLPMPNATIAAATKQINFALATTTTTTTTISPAAATTLQSTLLTSSQQQQHHHHHQHRNSNDSSSIDFPTTATTPHSPTSTSDNWEDQEFQAFEKINLTIRTPPGPVTQLYFKASTILGFLIWRFNKTNSGGYPVRSFTAEFRNISYETPPFNKSYEHEWNRMDPINIAPNVRQMEVYRLEPNTTYEFRIWANNLLGSGEVVTTNVTTLPETKEEDLIRLIQPDLDNFDPRIWIVAVSIVLGTLVILAIGLCIVLSKECYQSSRAEFEDGWESIEIIPNIILNPGFCESDDQHPEVTTTLPGHFINTSASSTAGGLPIIMNGVAGAHRNNNNVPHHHHPHHHAHHPHHAQTPFIRTIVFDDSDDSCDSSESDHEPRMEKFKRKLSVFFTDPTIKRI